MADNSKAPNDNARNAHEADEDEQELTFEHGYGAQDDVLSGDESLEDIAGVSEKDVHDDLLGEQPTDEADKKGDGE